MCGICGKLALQGRKDSPDRELLQRMMETLRHRGPDDDGVYLSGEVALGHLRLKIIDLNSGKQPISNEDGTIWVIYNGEIYNYKELTADLVARGHRFRTATDTEVIVHLYEELGEECVARLQGMFSFALWDEKKKTLLLARDRVGIKPLYYTVTPEALLFASEIKALLADPSVAAEVEPAVLDRFLTYFYVPGEQTLFRNIHKLSPGHYLVVRDGQIQIRQYWDLHFGNGAPVRSFGDCVQQLDELLARTVENHMISDVPVGVLLSGGVDSTAMLSYAVARAHREMSTFTIGFEGTHVTDERPYARLAAEKFGSKHYDMTITARDFLSCLPKYVWHMEEPVCEPPAIALYYVSKLAREHVTVLLSGEGGDEAFAGYQTYRNLVWMERIKSRLPLLAGPISALAAGVGALGRSAGLSRHARLMRMPLEKYYFSRSSDPLEYFNQNRESLYTKEFRARVNGDHPGEVSQRYFAAVARQPNLSKMLYVDTKTWLPDDLLIKADKMTMANSLELRVPLLDHQVLEFAAALPARYKLNGLTTKYILKKVLSRKVPREILDRKKKGFPVPYETWLRNEGREFVREILLDGKSLGRGYFRKGAVESLLSQNAQRGEHAREVFCLVVLELWHRTFVDRKPVAFR